MKVIITEDIVRNALNESIDEFIINEGFWDSQLGKGLKATGNFIRDGYLIAMDYLSNGEYTAKWGDKPRGNSKMTEIYYLNQWFKYHLKQIRRIEADNADPTSSSRQELHWVIGDDGKKRAVQYFNRINDVPTYSATYITPQAFNYWIRGMIKNQHSLECIDAYIRICSTIKNSKVASQVLNIYNFLGSPQGKQYIMGSRKQLYRQNINARNQQTQQQYNGGQNEKWNFGFDPQQQNSNQSQPNANNKTNRLDPNYGKVPDLMHPGKFLNK